jgi:glycosyltransferase involved in cell wall biosynthesis
MSRMQKGPIRVMRIIARMNVGGPAVQVSGLMRGINSVEFDQRLYTGFCSEDEADYLELIAPDVKSIRINGLGRRVNLKHDASALLRLIKEIRKFNPHIIHTHTAKAGFLGRIASLISLRRAIRVHTFHGHLLFGYFGPRKRLLVVIAEAALSLFTHQLLAVGSKVRQDLLKVNIGVADRFETMPPGLELSNLPDKTKSKFSLGLLETRLQCAFIGRLTHVKRPDRFLDVVAESKKRALDLDFFIAGDGDLFGYCQERVIREDLPVTLLGWQSNIELILAASDIVMLTSDNEGTPLSLIQAGMAGLPVLTTNVGSVPEIVLNDVTGIVVELDVQMLADALEKLVLDGKLRDKLGASAKEFTRKNFGVSRLVQDHEELYKKLISSRARS